MERVQRIDRVGTVHGVERTPQGGVRVLANVAKVGVLSYRDTAGRQWSELVPPETAFAEDSLATLRGAPVTDLHPTAMVTAATHSALARGHTGDAVGHDATYVTAPLVVQDAGLVAKIDAGQAREVSPGYTCEIDPTPGEWQGQRYDAVQRNRVYNHVALGPVGWARGGNDVSLRMDGAAVQVTDTDRPTSAPGVAGPVPVSAVQRADSARERTMPKKLKVRGREYKADDDGDMDAAQGAVDELAKQGEEASAKVATLSASLAAAETALIAAVQQVAAAGAAAKAQEAAAAGAASKPVTEADVPEAVQDAIAAKRLALCDRARSVLGTDAKFDGKSADVIRREVVAKALPTMRLDSVSAEALTGMFEALTTKAATSEAQRTDSLKRAGEVAVGETTNPAGERQDAATSLQKRLVDQGTAPLTPRKAG